MPRDSCQSSSSEQGRRSGFPRAARRPGTDHDVVVFRGGRVRASAKLGICGIRKQSEAGRCGKREHGQYTSTHWRFHRLCQSHFIRRRGRKKHTSDPDMTSRQQRGRGVRNYCSRGRKASQLMESRERSGLPSVCCRNMCSLVTGNGMSTKLQEGRPSTGEAPSRGVVRAT